MKIKLIFYLLLLIVSSNYSQTKVRIEGKDMFIKTSENITAGFKIFNICENQKLTSRCSDFYIAKNGNYLKLPLLKTQLSSALNSTNFSTIKGVSNIVINGYNIYFFQNSSKNIYLSVDEYKNLIIYPVEPNNDVFTIARKVGQGGKTIEEKCGKACPWKFPPECQTQASQKTNDCILRALEDQVRCYLKCKGKIRMTSIAPFEGIVINTKAN